MMLRSWLDPDKAGSTTRSSIALSIIAMNVDRLTAYSLYDLLESVFQGAWTEICCLLSAKNATEPIWLQADS